MLAIWSFVYVTRATYAVHLGVLHVLQSQEAVLQILVGHQRTVVRRNQHLVLQHQEQVRSDQLAGHVLQAVRHRVQQPELQQSKVRQRLLPIVRQGRRAVVHRRIAR